MPAKLESIAELAKRIGKTERQVRGWVDNSLLRHNRLGGKIEIPEGAFEEMLQSTEVAPTFERKKAVSQRQVPQPLLKQTTANVLDAEMLEKLASEF